MATARAESPHDLFPQLSLRSPFPANRFCSPPARTAALWAALILLLAAAMADGQKRQAPPSSQAASSTQKLKGLSLEQLGNIEVVTYNKEPSEFSKIPAAVYVITSDDILVPA